MHHVVCLAGEGVQYRLLFFRAERVDVTWLLAPGPPPTTSGRCSMLTQGQVATCKAGRGNLEALAGEQGRKLGDLVLAGQELDRRATQAQVDAQELARHDFAAASGLLQERTGGELIINQELGL